MIKRIDRTSTTSWSPATEKEPLLALGSVAGALDASFSSKAELEIYSLNLNSADKNLLKLHSITSNSRFNRIAWGAAHLACGKENGELDIWETKSLLKKVDKPFYCAKHSGPVRGLDFNPVTTNLLASGASDGEILIWDLNQISSPYEPGARSQRLEDVTCLAWNKQVSYILASGSTNGYSVIWDLRNRKELIKMNNPGGRKPITAISWNPDIPTQLLTCSDDDANPVILMWDLRNASAPEKTLSGHSKGVLSMDWCPKDSELLLSCGKDNRTIVWDTLRGIPIGDLVHSANWSFDTKWCPRNPDLCVVASYDGRVSVHSVQGASNHPEEDIFSPPPPVHQEIDPTDPFAQIGMVPSNSNQRVQQPVFTLPHPPKWLRKSIGAVWGFGGKLAIFDSAHGSKVSIKSIPMNDEFVFRTSQLEYILQSANPEITSQYCDYMKDSEFVKSEKDKDVWKFMKTLFASNSADLIRDFLGFDASFEKQDRLSALLQKLNLKRSGDDEKEELPPPKKDAFALFSGKQNEEADIDSIITKSIIVGDFDLAVDVCVATNRMADAFMLSYYGGPELIQKVQLEYFKKNSNIRPYARLLENIYNGDLTDVVEHAKLEGNDSWKELLALVCTYAKPEEYAHYFSSLGNRMVVSSSSERKHVAALCYLGAGELEKVVSLWCQGQSSKRTVIPGDNIELLNMIEKISIFRQAIGYQDQDLVLQDPQDNYALSELYDLFIDYAYTAATQNKLDVAYRFLEQVPLHYIPSKPLTDVGILRDRVYSSLSYKQSVNGQPPVFPFERVEVFDGEKLQREREAAEKARAIPNNQYQTFNSNNAAPANSWNKQPYGEQGRFSQSNQNYAQYQPPNTNQYSTNNQYPPSSGSYGQPPVSNQYNQGATPYPQPPSINKFSQPPVAGYGTTPPISNPYVTQPPSFNPVPQQSASVNQWVPPPPTSYNSAPPVTAATRVNSTGHAPPIAEAHYEPPTFVAPNANQNFNFPLPRSDSVVSQPPPPPIEPKIPTHDRSQITNPAEKALFESLTKQWEKLTNSTKSLEEQKNLSDGQRKLEILFDQMNSHQVEQGVIAQLTGFSKALENADYATAQKVEHDLRRNHFTSTGQWIVGIKRLVDGLEKLSRPAPSPAVQPAVQQPRPSISGASGIPPPPISGSKYGVNPVSSGNFGPPPIPTNSYGAPPISGNYNQVSAPPPISSNYGAPPLQTNYGTQPTSNNFGQPPIPNNPPPINNYGATQTHSIPPTTNNYGAPPIPSNAFSTASGFPPSNPPSNSNLPPAPAAVAQPSIPTAVAPPPVSNNYQAAPNYPPPPKVSETSFTAAPPVLAPANTPNNFEAAKILPPPSGNLHGGESFASGQNPPTSIGRPPVPTQPLSQTHHGLSNGIDNQSKPPVTNGVSTGVLGIQNTKSPSQKALAMPSSQPPPTGGFPPKSPPRFNQAPVGTRPPIAANAPRPSNNIPQGQPMSRPPPGAPIPNRPPANGPLVGGPPPGNPSFRPPPRRKIQEIVLKGEIQFKLVVEKIRLMINNQNHQVTDRTRRDSNIIDDRSLVDDESSYIDDPESDFDCVSIADTLVDYPTPIRPPVLLVERSETGNWQPVRPTLQLDPETIRQNRRLRDQWC
ncbi:protein transport protein S31 [Boothiomyces sp. JEL0866]|nr:protein transport protein S31 [Boothiomyces sp. JEL0866]